MQADAILELQLHRLTRLSIDEILKELAEVRGRIAEYEAILGSEKKLRGVIIKELEEIKKKYGDERRTIIQDEAAEISLEDLIADEQVAVTVSHSGYLKRTPISTYRQQRRGGTGRKGMSTREEDFVERLFVASTHDYILVFTNTGRVYWLKVYEIPELSAAGKGKAIANLVRLQPGENGARLADRSRSGRGKPVRLLRHAQRHGEEDAAEGLQQRAVRSASTPSASRTVTSWSPPAAPTATRSSSWPRMRAWPSASTKKTFVRWAAPLTACAAWTWSTDDYIVGMAVTPKERKKAKNGEDQEPSLILSVTEQGYGKRTDVDEYRLTGRGGKGVINVKTTARNGKVVSIMLVNEKSEVMVISQFGKIIRIDTKNIRESGRSAQGVRLLHLEEGDRLAAASVIPPEEAVENGNGETRRAGAVVEKETENAPIRALGGLCWPGQLNPDSNVSDRMELRNSTPLKFLP